MKSCVVFVLSRSQLNVSDVEGQICLDFVTFSSCCSIGIMLPSHIFYHEKEWISSQKDVLNVFLSVWWQIRKSVMEWTHFVMLTLSKLKIELTTQSTILVIVKETLERLNIFWNTFGEIPSFELWEKHWINQLGY